MGSQQSVTVEPIINRDFGNNYCAGGFKISTPCMSYSFEPEYEQFFCNDLIEAVRTGQDYCYASCESDGYFAITIKDGYLKCDNASFGDGVRGDTPFSIQLSLIKDQFLVALETIAKEQAEFAATKCVSE